MSESLERMAHGARASRAARAGKRRHRVAERVPAVPRAEKAHRSALPFGAVAVLVVAALVVLMAGLKSVAGIFGPSFLAFSLVIAVRPIRLWLVDRKVPNWLAGGAVAVFLYAILIAIMGSMAYSIVALVDTLPGYTAKFQTLYAGLRDLMNQFGFTETDLGNSVLNYAQPSRIISAATAVFSGLSAAGSQVFVLVMVMAFLMIDSIIIPGRRGQLLSAKPGLGRSFEDFSRRTAQYWVVNTVFGAIVAALDWIALMLLGVPLSFTWGVFAFVTNYIPNIGFVIGLIPPTLLGLLAGGPSTAIWVVVIFSVVNFVAQSVIQPKVTGDAVGLNTTVTFLSLMFWSAIIGPLGAILAVPLTLFFKAVLIDADPRSRWIGVAFDSRGKPTDLSWTDKMFRDDGRISLRQAYGPGLEASKQGRGTRPRQTRETGPHHAAEHDPSPETPPDASSDSLSTARPAPSVPDTRPQDAEASEHNPTRTDPEKDS